MNHVGRSPISQIHLTVTGTDIIPTLANDGLNVRLFDTPGFNSDSEIPRDISSPPARSYTLTHKLVATALATAIQQTSPSGIVIMFQQFKQTPQTLGLLLMALHYAPENWHQSLVQFNSTADNLGAYLCCHVSCDWATDLNNEEADVPNNRMRHFRCWDVDDMSSVSGNDQESLIALSIRVRYNDYSRQ